MASKLIYMFPGQGAQAVGMGADLFPRFPEQVEIANAILGYDIRAWCSGERSDDLNYIAYSQPALSVVNALHYLARLEEGNKGAIAGWRTIVLLKKGDRKSDFNL